MKNLAIVLGLFLVCSTDGGLTRFTLQAQGGVVIFSGGNLQLDEAKTGPTQIDNGVECFIKTSEKEPEVGGLVVPDPPLPVPVASVEPSDGTAH